jgi:hypothetical protein
MNWLEQMQRVEEWRLNIKGRTAEVGIDDLQKDFNVSVERATREISALFDQLLVFEPINWESEEDWLLSREQWVYLKGN